MIRKLISNRNGSSAAEFAIVLPLLLIFLLGIIDTGRWLWTFNRAEKAAQMGARFAVVTDGVSGDVASSTGLYSSFLSATLTQGDIIPASAFGKITCTNSGCVCSTAPCPTNLGTANTVAFNAIVARMKVFLPELSASNVTVEYSSSGLGYAGDPYGHDISPLVTVKIGTPTAIQFVPLTSFLLTRIPLPTATTSLTAEDLTGSQSN